MITTRLVLRKLFKIIFSVEHKKQQHLQNAIHQQHNFTKEQKTFFSLSHTNSKTVLSKQTNKVIVIMKKDLLREEEKKNIE